MKHRMTVLLPAMFPWGGMAAAQEKVANAWHCGKPDQLHLIPAPNRPNRSFSVYKFRCTPVKPDQIAGPRHERRTDRIQ